MSTLYANNAATTLAVRCSTEATSLVLLDGTSFPSPSGDDGFWLTLESGEEREIVWCTARVGEAVTVTRAQQGTTAREWRAGAKAELRWTVRDAEEATAPAALDGVGLLRRLDADTWTLDPVGAGGLSLLAAESADEVRTLAGAQRAAADLDALALLSAQGFPVRGGDGVWALRGVDVSGAGLSVVNSLGVSGNPTIALANDVAAIEALSSSGFPARTGTDTWALRGIAVSGAGLSVANSLGVAGNPTLALADDVAAIEALSGTGVARRTGTNAWTLNTAGATGLALLATATAAEAMTLLASATALLTEATPSTAGITKARTERIYWAAFQPSAADTNSPATRREWPVGATNRRHPANLTGYSEARLIGHFSTPGAAGSKISVQYSLDGGTTWAFLDGTADTTPIGAATPQLALDSSVLVTSAWVTIPLAARTDVLLRVVTSDGDGVTDPIVLLLALEIR